MTTKTTTMQKQAIQQKVAFLKNNYVSFRQFFNVMTTDGNYLRAKRNVQFIGDSVQIELNDTSIKRHVMGGNAVAIFAPIASKFVSFGVASEKDAKTVLNGLHLFGISDKQILVSFSGHGYHIDLFFAGTGNEKFVRIEELEKFYFILLHLTNMDATEVDFRPNAIQAVKLPFGMNHHTGKKCYIAEHETFTEIADECAFETEKVSVEWLMAGMNAYASLLSDNQDEIEEVLSVGREKGTYRPQKAKELKQEEIEEVLQLGHFAKPAYLSDVIYSTVVYLKDAGYAQEHTVERVQDVVSATLFDYKGLILDTKVNTDAAHERVAKVAKLAYERDYHLKKPSYANVNKADILMAMNVKKADVRNTLFALILYSKTHAMNETGVFELSYSFLSSQYGLNPNRSQMLKKLKELEDLGYIEIVERNKFSKETDIDAKTGNTFYKKEMNRYRLNFEVNREAGIRLDELSADTNTFVQLASQLVEKETVKKVVSASQWKTSFSKAYK